MGLVWSKAVEGEKMEPTRFVEVTFEHEDDNRSVDFADLQKDDSGDGDTDDVSSNNSYDRMSNYMFISSQHDLKGYKHSRCQDAKHLPKERLHCRGNCRDGLPGKKTHKKSALVIAVMVFQDDLFLPKNVKKSALDNDAITKSAN